MTSLIDDLLAEQRSLTAVERFARWHDSKPSAARESSHRTLIPLSKPGPGEQYAFEVDLDKCSGCKSCVTACHALNGLDEDETWRSVGVLHGQANDSFQQTITTACHHCVDPGCVSGCPVLAYDKDPATGIVRHLDDQCIGCQYCVLMCPYEVPKYSERRGIVRKCDMCHQRLANGEAPACAQSCPSQAIRITIVNVSAPATLIFPGAPDPLITRPTTLYISQKSSPANLHAGDAHEVKTQPAHLPLVWLLVLTQMGIGGFAVLPFCNQAVRLKLSVVSLIAAMLGMTASVLHLGQPTKAWRVFLGLRRSWMSREIAFFGAFAGLAAAQAFLKFGSPWITASVGLAGVFCSGMTYHVTKRECWRGELSLGKFFGTTLILGLATARAVGVEGSADSILLAVATLVKVSRELSQVRFCPSEADWYDEIPASVIGRGAYLMRFRFGAALRGRFACAWIGGIALPLVSLVPGGATQWLSFLALLLCFGGEWIERALFFRAAISPKMPGGL